MVQHKCFDTSQLRENLLVLLKLSSVLSHYDFGIAVFGDVETGFGGIGGVDARRDVVGEDGSHEGNEPLRSVEPNYVHAAPFRGLNREKGLSESLHIIVVLLPIPLDDLAIPFNLKCVSLRLTLNISFEERGHSDGFECGRSVSTLHVNGEFSVDVSGPEHILAINIGGVVLVAFPRHDEET